MNKITQNTWLLITIVFAVCLTVYSLSDIAIHPYHVITELGADGGKNNFTYLYHSLYGKGVWFDGMNYPYGEHIVYTDGQPILSVLLSYFKGHITIPIALGIMYGLISISYVLSIIFSYKTLRHFGVLPLIAILFAGLITVCSPQIFRLQGHYALSYACFIPMLFYWTTKYYSLGLKKYPLFIFITGCIAIFLHPYFGAVALVWAGCYTVGYLLFEKKKIAERIRHLIPLLGGIMGIFLFFGITMKLTDPMTDRPTTPYGILANCTHVKDIIASGNSPIWSFLSDRKIYTFQLSTGGEGYTYVGFAVLLVIGISAVIGLINVIRKKKEKNIVNPSGFQPVWLFTAFAALIFSMGIPFIWHLEWMTEYFSALKQFRTLGRFAWIFYYVITVYGVVIINNWYVRNVAKGKRAAAYVIIIAALAVWCFEADWYVKHTREIGSAGYEKYDMFLSKDAESWSQFLAAHGHKGDDFQAILIERFFEVGSEKLWLGRDISAFGVAMGSQAGIQLHLPIVDAMMSRTSWGQAFKQVKIAAGPYVDKPMLRDLKSDKPFLLFILDLEQPEPDQAYLLQASDSLGHIQHAFVYACYPSRIIANDKKNADSINALLPYVKTGDTCIRSNGSWYVQHFDHLKADSIFFGLGAMPYHAGEFTELVTIPVTPAFADQQYELSCWALTPADDYKSPYINIEYLDSAGHVIGSVDALGKESTDNHGLWIRPQAVFKIPGNCRSLHCRVGDDNGHSFRALDELVLRPVGSLIISKGASGKVMVNNHLFKR